MNKTIALALAALIGFYIYLQNNRYYLQPAGRGMAFKIDRKTGKTWLIVGDEEKLIKSERERAIELAKKRAELAEKKAIELAKNSHVFGDSFTVDEAIKAINKWLQTRKGSLKIYGWEAQKIDEYTYLVSYTFGEGKERVGFFFEVNLLAGIVRKVPGDPELEKKYGISNIKGKLGKLKTNNTYLR